MPNRRSACQFTRTSPAIADVRAAEYVFRVSAIKARMPKKLRPIFVVAALLLLPSGSVHATDKSDVATVDAGLGACQADFTVKDGSGKPIYGAKINVSIKYGFLNKREIDLEDATNSDGKALFTGLPNFPKNPLDFVVTNGAASKTITDDPSSICRAVFEVALPDH
jgi:hypothetical protein